VDLLLLVGADGPDAVGGFAHILAGASGVHVGARDGGAAVKILFVEQFSELGGGQQCLLDLLPAVVDRGWSAVVAAPGAGPLFERARFAGAETATIELGPYASGHKTAADTVRFLSDTGRLRDWIDRQDADLIYLSAPRPLVAAALGARGRPVIFHAQHFFGRKYAISVANWAIRRARATVIADSKYVAAQYTPERLHIVYNGVIEIPFTPHEFKRRIGIIGRIAPMKGQTDFLRAAACIATQWPDARFVICGEPMFSGDQYMEEVRRLVADLPVDFLGWRDDIGAVLTGLDMLVVPSTAAEATTRVILEAFSAGVPVVAYSIGGIPEIVHDGEDGFLVPECEPAALARKILAVAGTDLPSVAERARQEYERNYTVERYREQIIAIIAACLPTT
jgi:glycosyltransferase involved in cell wall biosynthesis